MNSAILLDVKEAANRLGLGTTKVRELIKEGELPAAKIGRRRVVRARDVEAFVARTFGDDDAPNSGA